MKESRLVTEEAENLLTSSRASTRLRVRTNRMNSLDHNESLHFLTSGVQKLDTISSKPSSRKT